MVNMLGSFMVLITPLVMGFWITYWLWRQGIFGRVCLLICFWLAIVSVYSYIAPSPSLQERYAQCMS